MSRRGRRWAARAAAALLLVAAACSRHAGPAPPPGADAVPPPDAHLYDARIGVDCLGQNCTPSQVCCTMVVNRRLVAFCVAGQQDCTNTIACDGPEDCSSGVCCVTSVHTVECAPMSKCIGATMCHTSADCGGGPCCPTPVGITRACEGPCPQQ